MNVDITTITFVLGVLVFLVNIITEITKSIYPLDKIHTNYYVTVLSIALTVLSYIIYISNKHIVFVWYHLVVVIIFGFVVAYLAMFGWDKLIRLWGQSQKKGGDE